MGQVLQNAKSIITKHLININKNDNIKFNALTRVQKYMATDQKKLIFSLFIKLQFPYCPLIWMFCTSILLVELTAYINDAYALFNKTTPLISK